MGAAGGLVVHPDHLAVLQDGDAGGAAADVHHGAVFDLQHLVCGGGLVQQGGDFKACALHHVLDGAAVQTVGAGRDGGCGVDELGAQLFLQLLLHLPHQPDGSDVVHHHAVPNNICIPVCACHRPAVFIQNRQHHAGGSQIHAGIVNGRGRFHRLFDHLFKFFDQAVAFCKCYFFWHTVPPNEWQII